jgi:hypothetical protein
MLSRVAFRRAQIAAAVDGITLQLERPDREPELGQDLYRLADQTRALLEDIDALQLDVPALRLIRRQLQSANPRLQGQTEFALWLRSHGEGETAGLVRAVDQAWRPPPFHPYLAGTIRWAREYRSRAARPPHRHHLIGELSEELGTARSKVATQLNHRIFSPEDAKQPHGFRALTSDIGLHVLVGPPDTGGEASATGSEEEGRLSGNTRILCTICNLDMDRVPAERYHAAKLIHEVCVKGENEGIFYNCTEHDPATQDDPAFLEQLERFDIFGR